MSRNCGDIVWIESIEGVCGCLILVIPHEPRRARRPLWRVSGLCRAYVCDSGLNGRFADGRDADLGDGHPKKWVLRPEGPISNREWIVGHAWGSGCSRTRLC
jgi:hypothetical protein